MNKAMLQALHPISTSPEASAFRSSIRAIPANCRGSHGTRHRCRKLATRVFNGRHCWIARENFRTFIICSSLYGSGSVRSTQ